MTAVVDSLARRSCSPASSRITSTWGFHNARSGICFPSYEAIAASIECNRDTVYEALKVLEWAGVLTWQNRIARIQVCERDLFGRWASRWRVIRTSNAYVFRDPQQRPGGAPASKSEIHREPETKRFLILYWHQCATRTAPWSGPCNSSAAPSKEDCS
jgi:hypothetical protein